MMVYMETVDKNLDPMERQRLAGEYFFNLMKTTGSTDMFDNISESSRPILKDVLGVKPAGGYSVNLKKLYKLWDTRAQQ
jgi:hypothetical protein